MEEDEEDTHSTYQKFMTSHEVPLLEVQKKYAPAFPDFDEKDQIESFGSVVNSNAELQLVAVLASSMVRIYDLDNIVIGFDRQVLGYIQDVVGPVNHPLYAIAFFD